MKIIISIVLISFITFSFVSKGEKPAHTKTISIALFVLPSVRPAFLPIFRSFELETGIKVIPKRYTTDINYEHYMRQLLIEGIELPDILYGHNGRRLKNMVEQGVIHSIEHLWEKNQWDKEFREEFVSGLTVNNQRYAIPYSFYTWGFFYKKSVTARFGPIPSHWPDFIDYCQKLKNAGITPFPASIKQPYIASAWFEYFILRIHGLDLFNQVLAGKIPFTDARLQQVFEQWKILIDRGFFSTEYHNLRWEEYLPFFLRENLAFVFMGTTLASRIFNDRLKDDVEFIPFPKISNIAKYETAPTDVFFIPKSSNNKAAAEKFISYIARADVQSILANILNTSPANSNSNIGSNKFSQLGHQSLEKAQGISLFFDRGTMAAFEKKAVVSLAQFISHGDINQITQELEQTRIDTNFNVPTITTSKAH